MKETTKKAIKEAVVEIVFVAILAAVAFFALEGWLEKKISYECGRCGAEYSWCPDYWRDKGMCSDHLVKSEVE